MDKSIHIKGVLLLGLISLFLCGNISRSQDNNSEPDPFMPLGGPRESVQTQPVEQQPSDYKPELFVETVTLKHLDAANMESAAGQMSSEYGTITTDEKTNSLIICDTKEALAKIVEQVKKADGALAQPMFIETITLKYLDAASVKTAIEGMSSEHGSISVDVNSNALILRDNSESLANIKAEIEKIDQPQQIMFVETIILRFLDAENLKEAVEKMLSPYGSIAVDENTNSLIVCDTEDTVKRIVEEVQKADSTPELIMIEVVLVDVKLSDDTDVGVNWDSLFPAVRSHNYSQSLISTLATTGITGGDFTYAKSGIDGTLHALQEIRNVEVLARPRILAISDQEAMIRTIEQIPYVELTGTAEGGSEALSSTAFEEAGITLTVKPTVTADGRIIMEVKSEQSLKTGETGVGSSTVPIIDKREAETTLLMEDGQVKVFGGMRKKDTRLSRDQIPILGELPIVGILFSSNNTVVEYSELLVFISPHIYKGEPLTDEEFERFNELRNKPLLRVPEEKSKKATEELLSALLPFGSDSGK